MPDGQPDGLRIIEKSNWTGRGVVCPRALLSEAKSREEFANTGVYVLSGPSESGGLPRIYVGEAESIRPRLDQHAAKKDFWTTVTFFVSKDENLNKAHVGFLEARLVGLARAAKRCELDNANDPKTPSLSEADTSDVEGFLEEMLLCFPVLGLNVFEKPAKRKRSRRELSMTRKGADAKGYESADGFVVLEGSKARTDEVPSMHRYVSDLRGLLLKQGVLTPGEGHLLLAQDYEFSSPSLAAAVFLGRNANGRVEWKDGDGRALKQIQEAEAASE